MRILLFEQIQALGTYQLALFVIKPYRGRKFAGRRLVTAVSAVTNELMDRHILRMVLDPLAVLPLNIIVHTDIAGVAPYP